MSAGSLGWSVSTAGDINRDGTTDLFIGAYGISSNTGAAYVLFGVKTPMPPTPISSATAPSTSTSTSSSSSSSILTSTSAITSTSATPSLFSTPISMTPVNSASSVPTAIDPTIPIVASVASVVVVGGVIGVVLLLRFKKKACFAESTRPRKNTTLAITDKAYA